MTILVTGAAGFIGSHLSEQLARRGHSVLGVDCLTPYYSQALKSSNVRHLERCGVVFERCDLAEDTLSTHLKGVDFVFHLAAQPGISAAVPFADFERNNVWATYRLLEATLASGVQGFVNVATSSVYGADATGDETAEAKPTSFYGVTKLAAEQLVLAQARDKGFPACSVRLFSVYGPRERPEKLFPKLIDAVLTNRPFPLYEGSLKHLRSYTYVGDIVDGLVATMDRFSACNGEILNLGTDTAITTGEGVAIVETLLGKKARLEVTPKRPGDQLKTHADITKARKLLQYDPSVTPEQGLEKEVQWYRDEVFGKIKLYKEPTR